MEDDRDSDNHDDGIGSVPADSNGPDIYSQQGHGKAFRKHRRKDLIRKNPFHAVFQPRHQKHGYHR